MTTTSITAPITAAAISPAPSPSQNEPVCPTVQAQAKAPTM